MRRTDYSTMAPLELLAIVARDGADCEAARVAAALMRPPSPGPALRCSAEAVQQLRAELGSADVERFYVVALDARNRIIDRILVSQGSLSSCMVHPREVFRKLVGSKRPAAACILAHNHPSGDPQPSPDDDRLTDRLCSAGRLLGVPVLDHVILAGGDHFSYRDAGKLSEQGRE